MRSGLPGSNGKIASMEEFKPPIPPKSKFDSLYEQYYEQMNNDLPGAFTEEEVQRMAREKAEKETKLDQNMEQIGQIFK